MKPRTYDPARVLFWGGYALVWIGVGIALWRALT